MDTLSVDAQQEAEQLAQEYPRTTLLMLRELAGEPVEAVVYDTFPPPDPSEVQRLYRYVHALAKRAARADMELACDRVHARWLEQIS